VEITVDDPTIIEHLGDAYEKVGKADRDCPLPRRAQEIEGRRAGEAHPRKNPASGEKNLTPRRLPTQGALQNTRLVLFASSQWRLLAARLLPVKSVTPELDLGQPPVAG
jgi:hypothetical protein